MFSYGDRRVLDGVNLTLAAGEHVGLVGRNGCGKSTLLRLMAGLGSQKPDDGQVQLARGATAGYLHQDPDFDPKHTLREEAGAAFAELARLHEQLDAVAHDMAHAEGDALEKLMRRYEQLEEKIQAAGGYAVDHKIEQTLHGLGLTDEFFDVPVTELSGGQKGRLALAKLLLSEPDVLLLDEPTNHLDIAGRQWLEQFLATYTGAVILISHDRWLLDRVVSRIYELERGQLVEFPGNYEKFVELRKARYLDQQRAFEKQQTKIKQEQAFIDRYRAGQRAKQAQGREKRLERYIEQEQLEAPPELETMNLSFAPQARSGDIVVQAEGLGVTYDQNTLFKGFAITIRRGDRIGVIGPNGAGKSTLVRCLLGEQEPTAGRTKLGAQVSVGYYRQTHDGLDTRKTVVEYLRPFVEGELEQHARDLAGAFLFSGLDQDKPLGVLSGGERSRAVLAGLMVKGHNLLVLDEPTNHLDIPSAERLEEALRQYNDAKKKYSTTSRGGGGEGTLILITHDRMLLDHLVDQLLIFNGHGHVKHFLGTYSDYIEALRGEVAEAENGKTEKRQPKVPEAKSEKSPPSKAAKKAEAKTGSSFSHLSQEQLEEKIVKLEGELSKLDAELADPEVYRDTDKVRKLQQRRARTQEQLQPLETEWASRA
ncbi:MAG: ATP-binding cassette domain-containing protein [Planctomycetes bacterium]|nr:ATP-binding cassette domain-containing protein [Planctomycetota bacterium]